MCVGWRGYSAGLAGAGNFWEECTLTHCVSVGADDGAEEGDLQIGGGAGGDSESCC